MIDRNIRKAVFITAPLIVLAGGAAAWTYIERFHGHLSSLFLASGLGNMLALVGLIAFVVMVALGTRFPLIERFLGLDRVYRIHKILGIAVLFIFIGHALLRTLAFSLQQGKGWAWDFLFYFGTRNMPLLLGHIALYILILVIPIAVWGRHRISYWLWKNSHLLVYPAVAVGLVHAWMEQGKHFASASNLALFVPVAGILISLSVYRTVTAIRLKRRGTWRVAEIVKETGDTATLVLERPEGAGAFSRRRAGQFAIIRIHDGNKWSEPHPFTISAPPHSDKLHFTIKAAGKFTSSIPSLTPGTHVLCEGPYGVFSIDFEKEREVVMISGGVGITPFLSTIRHAMKISTDAKIVLFCCNKTLDDIIAREELNEASAKLNMRIVHVLSKSTMEDLPPSGNGVAYERGHLTGSIVSRYVSSADASFYMCGPPPMQAATLKVLKETLGVPSWRVKREMFFY